MKRRTAGLNHDSGGSDQFTVATLSRHRRAFPPTLAPIC
jgi:hypothetical protein